MTNEHALTDNQRLRLLATQQIAEEGFWESDLVNKVHTWSPKLLEMLGLPREFRPTLETFMAMVHPEDREAIDKALWAHLDHREPYDVTYRLKSGSGDYRVVRSRGQATWDEQGNAVSIIGALTDITELQRMVVRLEESERRFSDLAGNIPGAIFRYILHPDGSDQVEYMSPGCFGIWEIDAEEIQGDPSKLWAAIDEEDLPAMQASVEQSAKSLSQWMHRYRITTPSGVRKTLEGHGSPSLLEDGSILWNSLVLDVTTEVEAQQELDKNLAMLFESQKQESLGRIAGGIAHDFNNLLAIVMGNAELLADRDLPARELGYVNDILQASRKGGELTRRLLSFARRSTLEPEVIDLNRTIQEMSSLLHRTVPENIRIDVTQTAGLWMTRVDKGFLESSLLNVVINARDAMKTGGILTIETANVRIGPEYVEDYGEDMQPGRYVMLAVSDTGVGIEPEVLPNIFDPFVTTKGPDEGTGLGLSMVYGFAKQSGGTVRVYSELDKGSTFKIYLKATEENAADTVTYDVLPSAGGTAGTILLVEDQEQVRKVTRAILEREGYRVLEAASGDQASLLFQRAEKSIDLLITDVVMPGELQGPDLASEVRADDSEIPVIFVSGYPHEAKINGHGVGEGDISLTKPIERGALLKAVKRALG